MKLPHPRIALCLAAWLLAALGAGAQPAPPPAPWEWRSGDLALRGNLQAQAWSYSMRGAWWNLAAASAPTFDPDRSFGELWLNPMLSGTYALGGGGEAYGGLSVGFSKTLSSDVFDYRNAGAVLLENAFVGVRGKTGEGLGYDVSVGRQLFTLGTGMLLTAGTINGYDWGAGASTPRKSWARTAIGRLSQGEFTGQAFVLEPSEVPQAYTDTRLQGVSLEWARAKVGKAGLAWITAPKSSAVYPGDLAPLAFIENGREGLKTWHGWLDAVGLLPAAPTLGVRAEFAQQRNTITRVGGQRDAMKAQAWLLGASYWAQTWWLAPRFSFHVARFSGDKPDTATFERFDPLYWGNGLDNWWFGANGAYALINSNVRAQRFIVDAYASQRDILQFQFVRASADQLNSAVQFGQGVRFDGGDLLVGVPTAHLSDEYYLQYARVISPALVAIAYVSRSVPGAGVKAIATQPTRPWTTLGLGLTANF